MLCRTAVWAVDFLPQRIIETIQRRQDVVGDAQALICGDRFVGHADTGHLGRLGGEDAEDGIFKDKALARGDV